MGSYRDTEAKIKHTIICICGESGKGKTFNANKLKHEYKQRHVTPIILDGDAVRKYINYELTYSDADRWKNNEIIANIAEMLYHQGHYVIISTVRADIAHNILKNKNIKTELIKLT
jgi:adenylylsulfate kinase-like enzyme